MPRYRLTPPPRPLGRPRYKDHVGPCRRCHRIVTFPHGELDNVCTECRTRMAMVEAMGTQTGRIEIVPPQRHTLTRVERRDLQAMLDQGGYTDGEIAVAIGVERHVVIYHRKKRNGPKDQPSLNDLPLVVQGKNILAIENAARRQAQPRRPRDFEPPNEAEPTTARPGTPEKVQVLAARIENGMPLWHPADAGNFEDADLYAPLAELLGLC